MSKLLSILILSLFALSTYTQWVGTGHDAPAADQCGIYTDDESDACMMIALEVNQCYQISLVGCQDLIPITPDGYCTSCEDVCDLCLMCGWQTGPACCSRTNPEIWTSDCRSSCYNNYAPYGCGV